MSFWHYLLLVNIYLLLFYAFYAIVLQRETFFQLNRIYLLAAVILSFALPFVQSIWVKNLTITQKVQQSIFHSPVLVYQFRPVNESGISIGQIFSIFYITGLFFLAARFIWQLFKLKKIITETCKTSNFSFFNKINIEDDVKKSDIIIAHEQVHAGEWHSIDVLLMELVIIINWINPVTYLYRNAIKHLHEFIANRQALKLGRDKTEYALMLLSHTFNTPVHQLVNAFNNKSLLKQRIVMLNKGRSKLGALIKYCLLDPLFILMLILSSASVNSSQTIRIINKKAEQIMLVPAPITINTVNIDSKAPVVVNYYPTLPPVNNLRDSVSVLAEKNNNMIFTQLEKNPDFPGGFNEFGEFLARNIKYPTSMRLNKIQGRVIVNFVVEKDGSLTNIHVLRGVVAEADSEAVRVLKLSPKWIPGVQNGKRVRASFTVPIMFTLVDDQSDKKTEKDVQLIKYNRTNPGLLACINTNAGVNSDTASYQKLKTKSSVYEPLYIIDGKESNSGTALFNMDAKLIKSVSVLKDKASTLIYGPKGVNGVVIVTLKTQNSKVAELN